MQALAQSDPGSPVAGLLLAILAAVLFAVGAVLQHEAAELSTTDRGLSLRLLMKRRRWMLGQTATMSGTGTQVAALAVAPVAVVQPMLAVALVVGLGLRAVRTRQVPLRLELIGAALTSGGLAVFLLYARPAAGVDHPPPASLSIVAAVVVSVGLVVGATTLGHGAHGALACGAAAGIAAGIAAVLISVGLRSLREDGWARAHPSSRRLRRPTEMSTAAIPAAIPAAAPQASAPWAPCPRSVAPTTSAPQTATPARAPAQPSSRRLRRPTEISTAAIPAAIPAAVPQARAP